MAKKIKFNFGFGLKAGLNGADGRDGLDGSNGVNGRDGVDGIPGRDGLDGTSARFRYAKTANKDTIPPVVFDNINPGSIWGAVIPMYNSPEAVWMIQADVNPNNTLKSNWVGPVRVTGIDGLDGTPVLPPNYNISVFKQSETLPAKPTYSHIDAADKEGWVTYPNMSSGTWWESIGSVEGVSGNILSWSEPIRKTPIDPTGEIGQDGNSVEKRRAYHQSSIDAPSVDRSLRTPPGWSIDLGTPPPGNYYVWEITASIKPDNSLNGQWSTPYRLTGKEGEGSPVPEYRWAVNKSLVEHPPIDVDARIPGVAWSTTIPVIEEDDHVWETMALINSDDTLYSVWHTPVRKTGAVGPVGATGPIGERGPTGSNGTSGIPGVSYENRFSLGTEENFQATFNGTVAGTRNPSGSGWSMTIPTTTEAFPHIWQIQARIQRATNEDPSGALEGVWSVPFKITGTNGLPGNNGYSQIAYPQGTYSNTATYTTTTRTAPYVLDPLDGNFYIMNFIGSWNGQSQNNISPSQDYANNGGQFWQLIQAHEAIYTKLLISPNGLLGEAVFNQQYMFSQTGVNSSGTHSSNYELFNPAIPTGGAFTPNMMINFANGEARFARGNVVLGADGNVNIKGHLTSIDGKIGNLLVDSIQTEAENERTTIGYQPSSVSSDPTKDFSKHAPRGYYPSGRIGWTISYIPSSLPITIGTATISDAFALVFYKDESGSPIHGAFSSNLDSVVFATNQVNYYPVKSIKLNITNASLTLSDATSFLTGAQWIFFADTSYKTIWMNHNQTSTIHRRVQAGQPTRFVTGTNEASPNVSDGWYLTSVGADHDAMLANPPGTGIFYTKYTFTRYVGGLEAGTATFAYTGWSASGSQTAMEYTMAAAGTYYSNRTFPNTVYKTMSSSSSSGISWPVGTFYEY